jgi:hypothetical protein
MRASAAVSTTAPEVDEEFAPPPPRRSWWRRLRKLALWGVSACFVIVVVLLVGRWQIGRIGQRQLNATTEQLDTDDPGWRLEALLQARKAAEPPAKENAAPLILDLAERLPKDWTDWRKSDEGMEFGGRFSDNHLPPRAAIDAARKPAASTLLVRTDAIRLRHKSGGSFPLTIPDDPITASFPHLDKCRGVVGLLQYDAYLAAAVERNPDRGISAARAALAVARAIGDEPFLIGQLVRIACASLAAQTAMQVLAWSEPTEGLAELQAELLAEADVAHFRIGMRGERAAIDRMFRGLEDGTIPAERWFVYADIKNPGPEAYAAFRAYRALLPGDHAKALEILTRYIAASKLPPHEQLAALKEIPLPEGPPNDFRHIVTRLMLPACNKVAQAGLRCRADLLAAATGIACERFRRAHNRWPRDLSELVPAYLSTVPQNPFDGKPLTYRTFEDRIAVFGFWADAPYKIDELPADFREGAVPGLGIGYRVWGPAQRGLPAQEQQPEKKNP